MGRSVAPLSPLPPPPGKRQSKHGPPPIPPASFHMPQCFSISPSSYLNLLLYPHFPSSFQVSPPSPSPPPYLSLSILIFITNLIRYYSDNIYVIKLITKLNHYETIRTYSQCCIHYNSISTNNICNVHINYSYIINKCKLIHSCERWASAQ